jgi:hypothetical protein
MTPEDFDRIIDEATGVTRHATRDRPYDGQPQTDLLSLLQNIPANLPEGSDGGGA